MLHCPLVSTMIPNIKAVVRISLLTLVLGMIGHSLAAGAPMDPAPVNTGSANKFGYKMIASILMQLRDLAKKKDQYELLELLNRTRFSVPFESLKQQSPNAYAYNENNQNLIIVEQRWMDQVAGFSDLAALFAIAEAGWSFKDQFHDFYRSYCRRFQQAYRSRTSSSPALIYQFRISDYYSRSDSRNAGFYITYDKVAGVTFYNTIVWTVLHEMGHHALKHTSVPNPSYAQRRADELAADRWAFERMRDLGYSLYPTGAYFLAREWSEECFRDLNLVKDESESTHPNWFNRTTPLVEDFSWRNAADQISRIYFLPMLLPNGQATYVVLSLSDPSRGTLQATLMQFSRVIPAIAEWGEKTVVVYVRDADRGRYEYTLKNPYQVLVSVEQRQYDSQNKLVGIVELQAIQQDVVAFDFLTTGGIRFGDVRVMAESGDSWIRHLRNLAASEITSARARARRDLYTAEKDRLDTEYMKGGPSLENYLQRFSRLSDQYKTDLINILGLATYNGLYDAVENEVNSYAPFLLNLDQDYEEKVFDENFGR